MNSRNSSFVIWPSPLPSNFWNCSIGSFMTLLNVICLCNKQFGFVIIIINQMVLIHTVEPHLSLADHGLYVPGVWSYVRIKPTSVPITFTAPAGFFTCTSLDFPRSFETKSDLNPILSNLVINSKTYSGWWIRVPRTKWPDFRP